MKSFMSVVMTKAYRLSKPSLFGFLQLLVVSGLGPGCIVELSGPGDRDETVADDNAELDRAPLPPVTEPVQPDPIGPDPIGPDPISPDPISPAADDDAGVAANFPSSLVCGQSAVVRVSVENRGTLAWTRGSHRLGALNDSDPFYGPDPRVYLPDDVVVAPGQRFVFEFTLTAVSAGTVTTDWQMVHEGVQWFGDIVSADVAVDCASAPEPDPAPVPGSPPEMSSTVRDVANEEPGLLAASCVNAGGNNDFLHAVVDRLRQSDNRWGYNWKRGNIGDMSQDVVDYYYGDGAPQEDSPEVFIVDIIGGHCGAVRPSWTDVTQATRDGGTIGRWTSLNRF